MKKKTFDIYQTVTDKIVAALEKGTVPWEKPWQNNIYGFPYNATSGRPYNGMNTLLLWLEQIEKGYDSAGWITFKAAKALGANVRKGEKATIAVFWKVDYIKEADPKTGKDKNKKRFYLRYYNVFNLDQVENLPEGFKDKHVVKPVGLGNKLTPEFEKFVKDTKAKIDLADKAAYIPALDKIEMPALKYFKSADGYAGTLLHELAHWTGAKKRLDRQVANAWATEAYAFEELVAELTSAFLQPVLGVKSEIENTAAYLDNWLGVLKKDKKAIFSAVSAATKAANFLRGIKYEDESSEAPEASSYGRAA